VEEEIDDTLRFNCDSSLDRTALTLPIVGAEEAEAEGVGRQVGAAANSGERTRTSATSRDSRLEASWRKRHKRVRVLSRSSRRFGKKKTKTYKKHLHGNILVRGVILGNVAIVLKKKTCKETGLHKNSQVTKDFSVIMEEPPYLSWGD